MSRSIVIALLTVACGHTVVADPPPPPPPPLDDTFEVPEGGFLFVTVHGSDPWGGGCGPHIRPVEVQQEGRTITVRLLVSTNRDQTNLCRALAWAFGHARIGPLAAGRWTVKDARKRRIEVKVEKPK